MRQFGGLHKEQIVDMLRKECDAQMPFVLGNLVDCIPEVELYRMGDMGIYDLHRRISLRLTREIVGAGLQCLRLSYAGNAIDIQEWPLLIFGEEMMQRAFFFSRPTEPYGTVVFQVVVPVSGDDWAETPNDLSPFRSFFTEGDSFKYTEAVRMPWWQKIGKGPVARRKRRVKKNDK